MLDWDFSGDSLTIIAAILVALRIAGFILGGVCGKTVVEGVDKILISIFLSQRPRGPLQTYLDPHPSIPSQITSLYKCPSYASVSQ